MPDNSAVEFWNQSSYPDIQPGSLERSTAGGASEWPPLDLATNRQTRQTDRQINLILFAMEAWWGIQKDTEGAARSPKVTEYIDTGKSYATGWFVCQHSSFQLVPVYSHAADVSTGINIAFFFFKDRRQAVMEIKK